LVGGALGKSVGVKVLVGARVLVGGRVATRAARVDGAPGSVLASVLAEGGELGDAVGGTSVDTTVPVETWATWDVDGLARETATSAIMKMQAMTPIITNRRFLRIKF
jgi:hypothetical protein